MVTKSYVGDRSARSPGILHLGIPGAFSSDPVCLWLASDPMQEGPVSETAHHFLCQLEVQGCLACAPGLWCDLGLPRTDFLVSHKTY